MVFCKLFIQVWNCEFVLRRRMCRGYTTNGIVLSSVPKLSSQVAVAAFEMRQCCGMLRVSRPLQSRSGFAGKPKLPEIS